ncbi:MAG: beta-glucosidase [Clostridiales bacterium]|nr:beta-glucosidase [Clostridiales bacterium]
MSWHREQTVYGTLIRNEGGKNIGFAGDVPVIERDGYAFKDLARTGELLPYEDWRLDARTRARDLAARLSREEIAGLMLYSSHQMVPFQSFGPFGDTYGGEPFDPAKHGDADLTDGQVRFIRKDHIRHILQMRVKNARVSAQWSNNLQAMCEAEPWGIPVNISTDPRHGAAAAGAEYRTAGSDVSKWPEGIGFAAAGDPELVRRFAQAAAKEYRALGITTALGPQIDLSTEPRWMRLEDTLGSDPEKVIPMVKAYCDGMQTTEGTRDGWGTDSVITMVKHWPGGGTGEGGRDAHYPYGCFAVYPGGQFEQHMRPFTEGAFRLDGPTKRAGAVMPYYTVSWLEDHEKVGNSYNEYILRELLRGKYQYDGVVCTDWGITADPDPEIDSFGSRCYGVNTLTEAERHLRIIMNGADQFGGNNRSEPVLEAWRIGEERYGAEFMGKRMRLSAERLLTGMFRVGLFENPYLDPDESERIVGNAEFVKEGLAAQARSVVALRRRALPLPGGCRVWIPERETGPHKSFVRTPEPGGREDPLRGTDLGGWFTRAETPEEADAAIVFMESPLSDPYDPEDRKQGGNGYRPLTLQYRPYTAAEAREESIGGGDFREDFTNRSYRGKSNRCYNEKDLDNLEEARRRMGNKPVIACMYMHNPTVPAEWEGLADGILVHFGCSVPVLLDIIAGKREAGGKLPYNLPKDMAAVEKHNEDDIRGPEPYACGDGAVWQAGT